LGGGGVEKKKGEDWSQFGRMKTRSRKGFCREAGGRVRFRTSLGKEKRFALLKGDSMGGKRFSAQGAKYRLYNGEDSKPLFAGGRFQGRSAFSSIHRRISIFSRPTFKFSCYQKKKNKLADSSASDGPAKGCCGVDEGKAAGGFRVARKSPQDPGAKGNHKAREEEGARQVPCGYRS